MTFDELRLKLKESRGHVYILDAACDSLYPTFIKLFVEVERLQAIAKAAWKLRTEFSDYTPSPDLGLRVMYREDLHRLLDQWKAEAAKEE